MSKVLATKPVDLDLFNSRGLDGGERELTPESRPLVLKYAMWCVCAHTETHYTYYTHTHIQV